MPTTPNVAPLARTPWLHGIRWCRWRTDWRLETIGFGGDREGKRWPGDWGFSRAHLWLVAIGMRSHDPKVGVRRRSRRTWCGASKTGGWGAQRRRYGPPCSFLVVIPFWIQRKVFLQRLTWPRRDAGERDRGTWCTVYIRLLIQFRIS